MTIDQLQPPVTRGDHAQGTEEALVTLVEYGDYECPLSGQAHWIVKRMQNLFGGRLRFVFRNFPLENIHSSATEAAEFAEAADLQEKFWEMHAVLFEHQQALSYADLIDYAIHIGLNVEELDRVLQMGAPFERVRADRTGGVRSGVIGTPAFFINGVRFRGNWRDEDALRRALLAAAAERAEADRFTQLAQARGTHAASN